MCLHKLAICCEKLGKREEAIEALDKAVTIAEADPLDLEMCALVRYRMDHKNYLYNKQYGEQLIKLYYELKKLRHHGYVKFHLPWMLEWLKANRKYKEAYELMCDFTNSMQ